MSVLKNKMVQLVIGVVLGLAVMLIPRPEGNIFEIIGDPGQKVLNQLQGKFTPRENPDIKAKGYLVEATGTGPEATAAYLKQVADGAGVENAKIEYANGISPSAHRFAAVLIFLIFMFVLEPIPLEITALLIGVLLTATGVSNLKDAWGTYMHPVVMFIMCCLIFAIALEKAGITKRMGHFIASKAGDSPTKFTFILACGLGIASAVMHDAAATAIAIASMLPLMRAAGIQPHTNTAKFMMLAVPFACSSGGMGTLVGGGRCMVSAAFLKEFTGIEITFLDWMIFAMPAALITVPASVFVVWLLYRPDPKIRLPKLEEEMGPWTSLEKRTVIILALAFLSWLTKSWHGLDYSVTGPVAVAALVVAGSLKWDDIHQHLEWGTALFIFGGGLSLGLAMENSGLARYFANLFFPLVKGGGWLLLFAGIGVFGALVTNVMANVAAAALILPIALPLARLEGVDPRIIALCLGMATSFAMLLVIGCPPNAIAYSYRQFKAFDLTKAGLVAVPILLGLLVLVASVWWRILGLV
ncbi:MAG: DASS family sodium-coupled anion symporter [Pseudomonadota bacterium]